MCSWNNPGPTAAPTTHAVTAPTTTTTTIASSNRLARSAHRLNEHRGGGIVAELAPHMAQVNVDQVWVTDPPRAPDLLDELVTGERPAGLTHQRREHVELGPGQLDLPARDPHLPGRQVNVQVADLADLVLA